MNAITRLQISRCAVVSGNRLAALIHLNEYNHAVGKPVMVRYTDENGNTDTITAIGVKSGIGKDCYSIISYGQEGAVGNVFFDVLPDVSSLVHDIPYIGKLENKWCVFYIDNSNARRQSRELRDGDKFFSLADSHMYYYNGKDIFRDDKAIDLLTNRLALMSLGELQVNLDYQEKILRPGESINRPMLDVSVLDVKGNDLALDCEYSVVDENGDDVPCEIFNGKLLLATTITSDKEYTITAYYTNSSSETPIYSSGKISFEYHTPIIYGRVGVPQTLEYLWDEKDSFTLTFNLVNQKSFIKVPSSWPAFKHIYDVNGLDYIDEYKVTTIDDWTTYEKETAVTINNLIQTFTR